MDSDAPPSRDGEGSHPSEQEEELARSDDQQETPERSEDPESGSFPAVIAQEKPSVLRPNELRALLQNLPSEAEVSLQVAHRSKRFMGPLPPPEMLQAYKDIDERVFDFILTAANEERRHRHQEDDRDCAIDEYVARARNHRAFTGQILGFIVSISVIAFGVFLTLRGHPKWGAVVVLTTIVGLTTIFVTGRRGARGDDADSRLRGDIGADDEEDGEP